MGFNIQYKHIGTFMATDYKERVDIINGGKIMNKIKVKHISFEKAPKSWADRCSGDGYDKHTNEKGERVYSDCGIVAGKLGYRPCAKCGKFPNKDGDDACFGHLGKVVNACCGHGKHEGYIQFDNGVTVRGVFKIEIAGKK